MTRISLTLWCMLATTAVLAHEGATGVVKARMDMMKDLGATMKSLSVMMKAGAHDAEFVASAGRDVMQHSAHLADMFPMGSGEAPSEAAPAIWTDRARFDALFGEMGAAGERLSATAADPAALPDQIKAIAATCRDCHQDFRVKR